MRRTGNFGMRMSTDYENRNMFNMDNKKGDEGFQDTATHGNWRSSTDDNNYCLGRVNSGIMASDFEKDECANVGGTWRSSRRAQFEPTSIRAIPAVQYPYRSQPQTSSEENWDDEIANSGTPSLSTLSNSTRIYLSPYSLESVQTENSYGSQTNGNGYKSGYHGSEGLSRCYKGSFDHQRQLDRPGFKVDSYGLSDTQEKRECLGTQKMDIPSGTKGRVIGRGGGIIRDIKEKSGLRTLKVLGEDDDGWCVPVLMEGSDEAVAKAKQLIDDIVNPTATIVAAKPTFSSARPVEVSQAIVQQRPMFDWGAVKEEMKTSAITKWAGLPVLKKDFYFEDPAVANMDSDEVAKIRLLNNKIMVQDLCPDRRQVPNPVRTFVEAFTHYPDILDELYKQGFERPSPIQMQGWPIVLSGMDLIGIAQTGTGKTIAFLLPAFIHIDGQQVPRSERNGPTVLVLSPTRELALQIEQEVKKYSYHGIKCVCVYGGGSRREQINICTRGVEIVVATPGRLNDLVNAGVINLKSVSYLVLDEADRMLDLGFEPEIRKVLLDIRPDRHTIMTSATWPEGVRRLAKQYMKDPVQVQVGSLDLTAVHSVTQLVEILPDEEKRPRLLHFLCKELKADEKVIVFVGKKVTADDISSDLTLQGIYCQSIHGDREQCDREQALRDLKEGAVNILIATDVASRGLDIKDITHVFNFDFPKNIEEYVHRVGRTGRAGRTGTSISLMTRSDWSNAQKLIDIMEEALQEIPPELADMAQRFEAMRQRRREEGGGERRGRGGRGRGFGGRGRRDRPEGINFPMYGIA